MKNTLPDTKLKEWIKYNSTKKYGTIPKHVVFELYAKNNLIENYRVTVDDINGAESVCDSQLQIIM